MTSIHRAVRGFAIALLFGLFTLSYVLIPGAAWADEVGSATAVVLNTAEADLPLGEAQFFETPDGLNIQVQLAHVPPGNHGFHIHANGSCAEGGQAAGGHYNPADVKHGYLPTDGFEQAHAGDLGNIAIAPDGTGTLSLTVPELALEDGPYPVVDHAVILHADADDFGQPTGNAGGRIGCGVIRQ